jgi:hypothetical protein
MMIVNGVLLLGSIGLSLTSGVRVARRSGFAHAEARLVIVGVVAYAQVVAVLQFAGFALRTFAPVVLVALHVFTTAVAVAATRSVSARTEGLAFEHRSAGAAPVVVTGLAAMALWAVRWTLAWLYPVTGFDPLHYHLPSVASWRDAGTFSHEPFAILIGRFPANADLLYLHVLSFVPLQRLVAPAGFAFLVLFGIAVAALTRSLGATSSWSRWSGLVATLIPVALAQSTSGYIDLAVAAFACALAALICECVRARERTTTWTIVVAGLAAGLLAGSKFNGVAPAVFGAVALLLPRRWSRTAMVQTACYVTVAVGLGGSWYVRNLVEDASPVAPYELEVAGVHLFDGLDPAEDVTDPPAAVAGPKPVQLVRSTLNDARLLLEPRSIDAQDPTAGFGMFWPFAGIPALAYLAVRMRAVIRPSSLWGAGVLVVTGLGTPYWWWTRFTLPVAVLGVAAFAVVASHRRIRRALVHASLVLVLLSGALGAGLTGYFEGWSGKGPSALRFAADHGVFVSYADVMPPVRWADDLSDGSVIAVDEALANTGYPIFPLYGRDLGRHLTTATSASFGTQRADARVKAFIVLPDGALARALDDPMSGFVKNDEQFSTGTSYRRV